VVASLQDSSIVYVTAKVLGTPQRRREAKLLQSMQMRVDIYCGPYLDAPSMLKLMLYKELLANRLEVAFAFSARFDAR